MKAIWICAAFLAAPAAVGLTIAPVAVRAQTASLQSNPEVVVTAQRLNRARAAIQPQVGASTFTVTRAQIAVLPAGQNAALNQVVLQSPGAAQDSFGQLHIRGEHNGLQFRLNGVILPEGLSVFSQALSPRLADQVELITGALPAEYGLRTAGIIDITARTGAASNGGSVSLYGGSHDEIEPSFEYGGAFGNFSLFVSGSYLTDDLGIESPDGRSDPLHDRTRQAQGFAYLENIIDPESRVSVILGASDQTFQIPDVSGGLNGGLGLAVNGVSNLPSGNLNENQTETTEYGVVSYLHSSDRFTSQVSLFARYSSLSFTPDVVGDILYNGISQAASKTDAAGGVQAEGSYHLNDAHTLRGGVIIEIDRSTSATTSHVLLVDYNPTDPTFGQQVSDQPFSIVDNAARMAETYSAYLQDEWKLATGLTLNYGVRFDQFDGFRAENQISPRINLVWLPTPSTTVHAGYARYFSPPPFELIANEAVQRFVEPIAGNPSITSTGSPVVAACGALVATAACPLVSKDTTPFSERANYFDLGAEQKVGADLTLTIDSYLKLSNHLVDEGQFGAPIILTPFNYARGRQYGIELTAAYNRGPFTSYANFAYSVAQGQDWISSQFNFPQAKIDFTKNRWIYLDHDERYAVSGGASYLWQGTRFGGDLIYGSGLRADLPLATPVVESDGSVLNAVPNGAELKGYVQVNVSVSHRFGQAPGGPIELRLDVINAFDQIYQIRNGTGVGVIAPQFGPRRGLFVGFTKDFS